MTMSLREGLSFCRLGDRIVFLDLPADRYFCLAPATETIFADACAGSPMNSAQCKALADAGLIDQTQNGRSLRECRGPLTVSSAFESRTIRRAPFTVARLFANFARTQWSLRSRGLAATLSALARRKPQAESDVSARAVVDRIAQAQRTCARTFGSHDRCLAYAIAVTRSLYVAGVDADIVIGVAMPPFRAHAWVQWRGVLVNERVEVAAHYTPILVL